MKRFAVSILLSATLLCPCHAAFSAGREAAGSSQSERSDETPLMVIRFNQPHVPYSMPLYDTVSRALKAKPGAVFAIMSVAPRAQRSDNQSYYDTLAAQNTHKVLTTLHDIGLPSSRISTVYATDDVRASEVRIFVH